MLLFVVVVVHNDEWYFPGYTDLYFYDKDDNKLEPDYENAKKFDTYNGWGGDVYGNSYSLRDEIYKLSEYHYEMEHEMNVFVGIIDKKIYFED